MSILAFGLLRTTSIFLILTCTLSLLNTLNYFGNKLIQKMERFEELFLGFVLLILLFSSSPQVHKYSFANSLEALPFSIMS